MIERRSDAKSGAPVRALHDPIRRRVSEALVAAARAAFPNGPPLELRACYDGLSEPPNLDLGDFAFGCFILAKAHRKSPAQAATELAAQVASDETVVRAQASGPYVNVTVATEALARANAGAALSGESFKRKLFESAPRTMVEFSQPNTHKELHVGHMRNLCYGDAVVRLLRYAGVDVVSSTFPGDVGAHVAKCLWYYKYRNTEPAPATEKGEWLGKLYARANSALEDELGGPNESENRARLTEILRQLEAKQGEFYELWKTTRAWSIELMEEVYRWAGVAFDRWYWESDVDAASAQWVRKLYAEGKLIKSEGAVGMDLEADGLGFCLLLKSDGSGLYATKDLELARRKFDEMKIEKSLYVVDVRQALHFKQVFKVLEKLGFEQAKACVHLQYNFVELPDGAMSSRKGNIVPLMELVARMEAFVKDRYLSRYLGEWTPEEIDSTASDVARGAIKYGMARIDANKKIVFEMEEWLKLDGESGPFIQYSHARVASLLRKLGWNPSEPADWSLLREPAERNLARALGAFNVVAGHAAETFKPAAICSYLYDLAKTFNVYYHECPIGGAPSPELRGARLALAAAAGETLAHGLGLLGIPAPSKM